MGDCKKGENVKYVCEFPGCEYSTDSRTQINEHHIVPREVGGSNAKWNKIRLCATHHSHIFCEDSRQGIHSIKAKNSIILKGWKISSEGKILEYVDTDGNTKYFSNKNCLYFA